MEKIMEAEIGLMIDDTPYYCGYNDDFKFPKPE